MGIFGNLFKKQNEVKFDTYVKNTPIEDDLFPDEDLELIDGQIMRICENGIINTNSYKAIEIYKHNLKILVDDALNRGIVDKFFLIREDNQFPKNFEWSVMSDETSFESTNLQISYQLRKELAAKRAGATKEFNGIQIPISNSSIDDELKKIDKNVGNLYLPSHFRSTKHFTVNTPLEATGDYNLVEVNRDYIIIDDISNFINSGYGYSVHYRDAYLDVSHEPLKISNQAIVLMEDNRYNELIKDEEVRNNLAGKNVIRYKGDTATAINMLLTEMGALPSKLSAKYVNVDNRIYDILNKSIEKLAMDNKLQLDRGHFGSNGHFSGYYDEQYDNVMEYTNAFAEFLKSRYPEQSNIIAPYIFESNVKNVTPNQIKYSAARIHELINNIGVEELINTINDFNAIMHLKEKENYSNYLDKQSKITPEMSEVFKKTTKLVDYYFDHRDQMNLDSELTKNVDKYILTFLHSKDLNEQYESACQLKTFIEQRMLENNIDKQDTNVMQK